MKKIIIVGQNSYLGKNLITVLSETKEEYEVIEFDTLSLKVAEMDFKGADSVYHVAGIAHVSFDPKMKDKYFEINRDLAVDTAKKAKADGAKQFIFMSSMLIYGNEGKFGKQFMIDEKTPFNAADFYGQSKLEADLAIQQLNDEHFKTAIIRSPTVFGKNCKGNFPTLVNFAKKSFIFPNVKNEKSMIYVENLAYFLKYLIDAQMTGVFYPQNKEYLSITEIIKTIAKINGNKIFITKIFNPLLFVMSKFSGLINKVFGSKTYSKEISGNFDFYCKYDNYESIKRSIVRD